MIKLNYAEYDSCSPDDKKKNIQRMVDKCSALGEDKVVVPKGNIKLEKMIVYHVTKLCYNNSTI